MHDCVVLEHDPVHELSAAVVPSEYLHVALRVCTASPHDIEHKLHGPYEHDVGVHDPHDVIVGFVAQQLVVVHVHDGVLV